MDIGAWNTGYTDYLTSAQTSQSANKLASLDNKDMTDATDEELMEVCQEFEAYFLEQVMKEMTKTIGGTDESESSASMVDYFKDTTLQGLAKQSTEQNSLGLAQMLYDQMKRNFTTE